MIVYIDSNYHCHSKNGEGLRAVENMFFDNKGGVFIEGYQFIPNGEHWTRNDGVVFSGEMITPIQNYNSLLAAQQQYEEDESIYLAEIGALIEEIYNEDLEVIG